MNEDLVTVLTDSPQDVSEAWEEVAAKKKAEDYAYARAYMVFKNEYNSSIDDAKYAAELDEDYLMAYVDRIQAEALHKKLSDKQINARKLAELAKSGI